MSENEGNPNEITVRVKKDAELEKLKAELLELKANEALEKEAIKLGVLDKVLNAPDDETKVFILKQAKAEREASPLPPTRGGDTAPLSQEQMSGRPKKPEYDFNELKDLQLDLIEYDNEKQMIEHLKAVAEDSSDERSGQAKKALGLLIKKEHEEMSHGLGEYEYSEGVKDLTTRKRGNRKGEWRKVRKTEA